VPESLRSAHAEHGNISGCCGRGARRWRRGTPAVDTLASAPAVCDVKLTRTWEGRSCRLRMTSAEGNGGSSEPGSQGKSARVCMTDDKENRIWWSGASSRSPPPSLLHGHAPSLSLTLTPLVSLSRTRKRAAKGGETVRALKGRFTVMHVDGRLLSSAPPVCHTALAAAQRRSLWKASTHTVAGEGREDRGGLG